MKHQEERVGWMKRAGNHMLGWLYALYVWRCRQRGRAVAGYGLWRATLGIPIHYPSADELGF